MTPEQEARMRVASGLVAEAERSPWEPRCVARAFATPRPAEFVLTMQGWIDLDFIKSPLIHGRKPNAEELEAAWPIFFGEEIGEDAEAEDAILTAEAMLAACNEAFAMALPMRPPNPANDGQNDGMGNWLLWFCCLVTQCGMSPEEAMAYPVKRAFALAAGEKRNKGWYVAGTPYSLREVADA